MVFSGFFIGVLFLIIFSVFFLFFFSIYSFFFFPSVFILMIIFVSFLLSFQDLLPLGNLATVFISPRVVCEKDALFQLIGDVFADALAEKAPVPPFLYCHTLWAFAKGRREHPRFLDAVNGAAAGQLHLLDGRTLSVLAWSFAKIGVRSPPLFRAIEEDTVRRVDGASGGGCRRRRPHGDRPPC